MSETNEHTPSTPELTAALAEAKALARDQVVAAWDIQIDRIREQLDGSWREALDGIFEERFVAIEKLLHSSWHSAVGTLRAGDREQGAAEARKQLIEQWNGSLRQLRNAETPEDWSAALLASAGEACRKATLFRVHGQNLVGHGLEIPLASAPAFNQCIQSKETMVAANLPEELSAEIAALGSSDRIYLFPIGRKVSAILHAEDPSDVPALELLAAAAGGSGDGSRHVTLTGIAPMSTTPKSSWVDLPKAEQEMHLRAQRFARTEVAGLVLHKVEQVHRGRASNSVYEMLSEDIDAARQTYRAEHLGTCPSMVDYLHLELVRTLGKGDSNALGAAYPGPLL